MRLQASWLRGAQQCLNHGITTLGNIETRRDLLPDLWSQTPLRMVSFLEIILLQPESDVEQELKELQTWIRGNTPPRGCGVLTARALHDKVRLPRRVRGFRDVPMAMHVGESTEENQMFREGSGTMFDMLARVGRNMDDCTGQSPLANVQRAGLLGERFVLVHGNYLDESDRQLISRADAHWVHCPRSHDYFGHQAWWMRPECGDQFMSGDRQFGDRL